MQKSIVRTSVIGICLCVALGAGLAVQGFATEGAAASGDPQAGVAALKGKCNICHTYPEAEAFSPMTEDEARAFLAVHADGIAGSAEDIDNIIAYLVR